MYVESIAAGVGAVGGTVEELSSAQVEEGPCGYCVESIACGMKSEREGRIEEFKNTLEIASASTFLYSCRCFMVDSN